MASANRSSAGLDATSIGSALASMAGISPGAIELRNLFISRTDSNNWERSTQGVSALDQRNPDPTDGPKISSSLIDVPPIPKQ
jgi:hypothetical protein